MDQHCEQRGSERIDGHACPQGYHFSDLDERRRMHWMRGGISPAFIYLCSTQPACRLHRYPPYGRDYPRDGAASSFSSSKNAEADLLALANHPSQHLTRSGMAKIPRAQETQECNFCRPLGCVEGSVALCIVIGLLCADGWTGSGASTLGEVAPSIPPRRPCASARCGSSVSGSPASRLRGTGILLRLPHLRKAQSPRCTPAEGV
jgi:hypothetical protein